METPGARFCGGRVGAEQVDEPAGAWTRATPSSGRAHLPRVGCRWGGWWGDDDLAADAADVDARPSAAGLVVQDLPAVVGPGEQVVDAAAAGERLHGVGQVAMDGLERPQAVVATVAGVDVQRPQPDSAPVAMQTPCAGFFVHQRRMRSGSVVARSCQLGNALAGCLCPGGIGARRHPRAA